MSTWNTPQWGKTQPGTVATTPAFPELYLRNFLNDEGILPSEATPLQSVFDTFTVVGGSHIFTLSKLPSQVSSPIVYRNGAPQTPSVNYLINSRTVTFPTGSLSNTDVIEVYYTS